MNDEEGDYDDVTLIHDDIDVEDALYRSSTEINSMHYIKEPDTDICEEIMKADGSFTYKPLVDECHKPKIGTEYATLDKCIDMYENYAANSGFSVRRGTEEKLRSGLISRKYLLCNKQGLPQGVNKDTMNEETRDNQIRASSIIRTGCLARVKFKLNASHTAYELYEFEEEHNHTFILKAYRKLTKKRKQMTHGQQVFIQQMSSTSLGPTKAHHLYVLTHGGYESVTATATEFRNYHRDLNTHIGDSDAQMLVYKMTNKQKNLDNFSFEYAVENNLLTSLFWADEMAKYNYKEFGDTISFDATFRTNKYNMVFVPFTGIDNHRKCVTFGAGMLSTETTKSYIWLLSCFLKAFKKQPRLVVTDQDPAMKNAIEAILHHSTHRLCIRHITNKLPLKICKEVLDNGNFRRRLHQLVWSLYLEPEEFEEKWGVLIEEYHLEDNKWLSDMYEIRTRWIPAYFRDVELCGLMRTTSRSESENSFFSHFTRGQSTLIHFMMSFEGAMEKQRHIQELLDDSTMQKSVRFKTRLGIERYLQGKYTRTMFSLIQEEINSAVYHCHQVSETQENDDIEIVRIREMREIKVSTSRKKYNFGESSIQNAKNKPRKELHFKVKLDKSDGSVICSCMNFARFGFLCRHIFCVLKGKSVDVVPDEYILRRWSRNILPPDIRKKKQTWNMQGEKYMTIASEFYSVVDFCLNLLVKDEVQLNEFLKNIKKLKTGIEKANPNAKPLSKTEMFNHVLGVEKRAEGMNDVGNPEDCKNKGSGSGLQRNKSELEKTRDILKRRRRNCKKCKKMVRHDSRNCKVNVEKGETGQDSDSTVYSETDSDDE